jgi:hypothetical protein
MDTSSMEIFNTIPILNGLRSFLKDGVVKGLYLNRKDEAPADGQQSPVFNSGSLGIREEQLPELLTRIGIRSIFLNTDHDLTVLSKLSVILPPAEVEMYPWAFYRDETVIDALRSLFNNCRTIAFDDWSAISGASNLWDGLLRDVIKQTGKNNLEFIFYLGDPAGKLSFEVDEAIDLISAFSYCGKVTFALDEHEALSLWMVLNGVQEEMPAEQQSRADLKKKYFSIYRTMEIERLLIYSASDAMIISKAERFVISRKKVDQLVEIGNYARQNFIAGFSIGLLKELDLASCIALGLIVFGYQGEDIAGSERSGLLDYLEKWLEDLQKPETIHLYQ